MPKRPDSTNHDEYGLNPGAVFESNLFRAFVVFVVLCSFNKRINDRSERYENDSEKLSTISQISTDDFNPRSIQSVKICASVDQ